MEVFHGRGEYFGRNGGVIHVIDAFNGEKKLKLKVPGAESSLVPLEPTWTPDGQFILCAGGGDQKDYVVGWHRSGIRAVEK